MNQKTLMIKPDITSMLMKEDSDYLYYVAKTLQVYDLKNDRTIQRLPGTYNSMITISNDGSLLVCVHPVKTKTEFIFYHVEGLLIEVRRKIINTPISVFDPTISSDNQYAFFCGDDNSIWKVAVSSGDTECIFRCRENEIITSMDLNDQGILISVYNVSGHFHDSFVLLLDHNGIIVRKYGFIAAKLNDIKLRNIGCIRISETSFVCLLRTISDGKLRSSLQTIPFCFTESINADNMQKPLDFDFYPYTICVSENMNYLALGGIKAVDNEYKRIVSVYSLPSFDLSVVEYFNKLRSLCFSKSSSTLLICYEKQSFVKFP
ncbi:MAG: PD40 domain-containing protein [Clostridia bacterium]|nr:PD40 domain-containing protein [Clostridia bacterium]